jgi:2-polyprenyl-3-methyl-5-hydroxy-6-metoxy-1,4-benzoquinol methylase
LGCRTGNPNPSPKLGRASLRNVAASDETDLVRRGYDAVSYYYRSDDAGDGRYAPWLAGLRARLPAGAAVLDLGCGCGVPVARSLADAGYHVTGVDVSDVQVGRARRLVPGGTFIRADATAIEFPAQSFDAVICLYVLIHLPLGRQPGLVRRAAGWLRPGGWLLAVTGHRAWTGTEDNWLGGPAPMWWSHADAATYRSWLELAGLEIAAEEFVPEGDGGHALFWALRSPGNRAVPRAPGGRAAGQRSVG